MTSWKSSCPPSRCRYALPSSSPCESVKLASYADFHSILYDLQVAWLQLYTQGAPALTATARVTQSDI